jgi:hypothetical protein
MGVAEPAPSPSEARRSISTAPILATTADDDDKDDGDDGLFFLILFLGIDDGRESTTDACSRYDTIPSASQYDGRRAQSTSWLVSDGSVLSLSSLANDARSTRLGGRCRTDCRGGPRSTRRWWWPRSTSVLLVWWWRTKRDRLDMVVGVGRIVGGDHDRRSSSSSLVVAEKSSIVDVGGDPQSKKLDHRAATEVRASSLLLVVAE